MHLKIGISPCPNDTFIFDALINRKIDTKGYVFEPVFKDVEELNTMAMCGELNLTKMSYRAFFNVTRQYYLLRSGGALGKGCGPLLIGKGEVNLTSIHKLKIAIPGKMTTAHFLLQFAYPEANNKHEVLFSDIEDAVLRNQYDLGVIIHESRFTYKEKGLMKWSDLGEVWEKETGAPIPLGCIAARRDISIQDVRQIDQLIRESIEYAQANPESSKDFICTYAQELSEDVQQSHIDLYVNDYSLDIGKEGLKAIQVMGQKLMNDSEYTASGLFAE